ncbi:MAG: hypothetical protein N2691_00425 [Patescibacteria group bacterium]|nr:hypothetical protein [Patescibacteria group bacterium]
MSLENPQFLPNAEPPETTVSENLAGEQSGWFRNNEKIDALFDTSLSFEDYTQRVTYVSQSIAETVAKNPVEGWELLEYLHFAGNNPSEAAQRKLQDLLRALSTHLSTADRPSLKQFDVLTDDDVQRILYLADVGGRLSRLSAPAEENPHRRKKARPEPTVVSPVLEEFKAQITSEEAARRVLGIWRDAIPHLKSDEARLLYSQVRAKCRSFRLQRFCEKVVRPGNRVLIPVAGAVSSAAWGAPALSSPLPWPLDDPMLLAIAGGTGAGGLATLAEHAKRLLDPNNKKNRRKFNWVLRNLANTVLATITAVELSRGAAPPTVDYRNGAQYLGTTDELSAESIRRGILKNPERIPEILVDGRTVRLEDIDYGLTVPVLQEDGSTSWRTALPIEFVDSATGEKLLVYRRTIYDGDITPEELPPHYLRFLNAMEGLSGEEAPLGEIFGFAPITSTDEFIARILSRNLSPSNILKLFRGENPDFSRGGSEVPSQLAKEIYGRRNSRSLIDPRIPNTIYDEARYREGLAYAWRLYCALRDGKVIAPEYLRQRAKEDAIGLVPPATADNKLQEVLFLLIEQMERRLAGRLLESDKDYVAVYSRTIRMGAVVEEDPEKGATPGVGTEILGTTGAARYLFGRHLSELNRAETIVVIMSIPRARETYEAFAAHRRGEPGALRELSDRFENSIILLQKKGVITPAEADEIRAEGKEIFENNGYSLRIPPEFQNLWYPELPYELLSQVDPFISSTPAEIAEKPGVLLTGRGIQVPIETGGAFALRFKPLTAEALELSGRFEAPFSQNLEQFLLSRLELRMQNDYPYYEYSRPNGSKIRLPAYEYAPGEYVPGLHIVILDEKGTVIAEYDPANTAPNPIMPASVIKGPMYALARISGAISGPEEATSAVPGPYAFAPDITVRNAGNVSIRRLTWAEALERSLNVPFAELFKGMIEQEIPGVTDPQERNRLNFTRLQNELYRLFGIRFTDVHGVPIKNPTDDTPGRQALTFAFGTEVYITGEGGGLQALTRAYGRFAGPPWDTSDPREQAAFAEVAEILKGLGAKIPGWTSMAKTGTHAGTGPNGEPTVSSLLTVLTLRDEAEPSTQYQIGVLVRGQEILQDNRVVTVNLSDAQRRAGVAAESFQAPLPLAQDIAEIIPGLSESKYISPEEVETVYRTIFSGTVPEMPYAVMGLAQGTQLYGLDGSPLTQIQAPVVVDVVGQVQGELQQITLENSRGELSMAFVPAESLIPLRDFLASNSIPIEQEIESITKKSPLQALVMDERVQSPLLRRFFSLQSRSIMLTPSVVQYGAIQRAAGLVDIVTIHPDRIADFFGEKKKTPATVALFLREFEAEQRLRELDSLIRRVLPGSSLHSVLAEDNNLRMFVYALAHNPERFQSYIAASLANPHGHPMDTKGQIGDVVRRYRELFAPDLAGPSASGSSEEERVLEFLAALESKRIYIDTLFR